MPAQRQLGGWIPLRFRLPNAYEDRYPVLIHASVDDVAVQWDRIPGAAARTVVLLHGIGGNRSVWSDQLEAFSQFGTVIALDMPGVASTLPAAVSGFEAYLGFIWRILDAAGVRDAVLVGNSFGGAVALGATLAAPERVRGLGLACSIGFTVKGIERPTIDELHPFDTLRRMYHDPVRLLPRMIQSRGLRAASPIRVGQLMRDVPMPDFAARLGEIDVPTSVIWGRQDGIVPLAVGEALALQIRNAELCVLERCGHLPHVEQPGAFNDQIVRLMQRIERRAEGSRR